MADAFHNIRIPVTHCKYVPLPLGSPFRLVSTGSPGTFGVADGGELVDELVQQLEEALGVVQGGPDATAEPPYHLRDEPDGGAAQRTVLGRQQQHHLRRTQT